MLFLKSESIMEEKLIEEVKQHEVLYKKSSLAYRNKIKRPAAWKSIAEKLNVPENVCQARWKTLRDRYVKKHAETYPASGSGADFNENPWQYYQQMEFLRAHIKPRKTVTSLFSSQQSAHNEESSTDDLFTSCIEEDCCESVESLVEVLDESCPTQSEMPSSSRKRSRRGSDGEAFKEFLSKMTKVAENRFGASSTSKENVAHEGFFSMVREIFQSLPNEVVSNANFFFINYLREQVAANQNN